jgi:hypothetical protein
MRPAAIGQETVLGPTLSKNRRSEGGAVDPEIGVITLVDERKAPIARLVNFAAHPTNLGSGDVLISGDFPGYLARYLEKRGGVVLFANGASADISPLVKGGRNGFEQARIMGESLAQTALKAIEKTETRRRVRISVSEKEIMLPSWPDLSPWFNFPLITQCLNLLADIWLPENTVLQVIAVDDFLLIGVPCDLGVEVGLEIKARVSPRQGYIISQANDYIGYVMTRDQYLEGGYEAEMSFYGPQLADIINEELVKMIEDVGEKR